LTTRVVVADDQRIVRDGLGLILRLLPGIELVGAAQDGKAVMMMVDELHPDVVLMDLRMPDLDGVEATRSIRQRHPSTQVVVLTTYADDASIFAALQAGARGYLTKDASPEQIAEAISRVVKGEAMLDPVVQARVLESMCPSIGGPGPRHSPGRLQKLTDREAEVLALIAEGLSNTEIAERLHVSHATVKTHVHRLFLKTGARDRSQIVVYAYRQGTATP
jgi:DNA-binding NarL/FixJ family response regulator